MLCAVMHNNTEAYRSGHNGTDSKSCETLQKLHIFYTEAYRSGHNGTDSKSVVPHGTVGSNPTASAKVAALSAPSRKGILVAFTLWRAYEFHGFI